MGNNDRALGVFPQESEIKKLRKNGNDHIGRIVSPNGNILFNGLSSEDIFDRYSNPENRAALEPAYSPFDAITGGVSGMVGQAGRRGTAFLANTLIDPIMESATQGLASSDNTGYAAILGRRGTGQLVKNYLSDKTQPARWFNGSNEKFYNFDERMLGKQSGAVKDSGEAFYAASDPRVANSYTANLRDLDKDFSWNGADKATQYNWLQKYGKNPKHRDMLRRDLEDPNSFDAKDFARLNHKEWQIENLGKIETIDTPDHYPNINTREMYLDLENPSVVDMGGVHYDEDLWFDTIMAAKKGGHDAVVMQNVIDGGGITNDVTAFWNPNKQVVSPYEHLSGKTPEPTMVERLWGHDAVEIAKNTSVLDGM